VGDQQCALHITGTPQHCHQSFTELHNVDKAIYIDAIMVI